MQSSIFMLEKIVIQKTALREGKTETRNGGNRIWSCKAAKHIFHIK